MALSYSYIGQSVAAANKLKTHFELHLRNGSAFVEVNHLEDLLHILLCNGLPVHRLKPGPACSPYVAHHFLIY